MCCETSFMESNKKRIVKKLIAVVICIVFIIGLFLSAAIDFPHIRRKHDHNGSDGSCAVCADLTAVENLLKNLSSVMACITLIIGFFSIISYTLKSININTGFLTLVFLKVRLNN